MHVAKKANRLGLGRLLNALRLERVFIDAPKSTDADGCNVAAANHATQRDGMDAQLLGRFLHGKQHQVFVP
jgi:hypothetical protein